MNKEQIQPRVDLLFLLFLPEKLPEIKALNPLCLNVQSEIKNEVVKANISQKDYAKVKTIVSQVLTALIESFNLSEEELCNTKIQFDPSYYWSLLLYPSKEQEIKVGGASEVFEDGNQITVAKPRRILLNQADFDIIGLLAKNAFQSLIDIGIACDADFYAHKDFDGLELRGLTYTIYFSDYHNNSTANDPISLLISTKSKTTYSFLFYPKDVVSLPVAITEIIPHKNKAAVNCLLDESCVSKLNYQLDVMSRKSKMNSEVLVNGIVAGRSI